MQLTKSTKSLKASELQADWYLIDATNVTLGRLAAYTATLLRGKNKPTFTPNMDCGDHVIIINAEKVLATGNKETDKKYYRHSGFPGGITELTLGEMRAKTPERVLELAIKGMLPVNKLAAGRMARLRVFKGENHDHTAQSPEKVEIK